MFSRKILVLSFAFSSVFVQDPSGVMRVAMALLKSLDTVLGPERLPEAVGVLMQAGKSEESKSNNPPEEELSKLREGLEGLRTNAWEEIRKLQNSEKSEQFEGSHSLGAVASAMVRGWQLLQDPAVLT